MWMFGSGGIITFVVGCEPGAQVPALDALTQNELDARAFDATFLLDACAQDSTKMHDTNAQALYLDGSKGPLTGVVTVAAVIAGTTVTLDFWHGHNGVPHRFTLEPAHFAALKRGERITLGTTTVDSHSHTLFVDPRDEAYRVSGAPDVDVPLGCT